MEDNENLHNEVEQIKKEYKEKEFDMEWKYKSKIRSLEKENNHLHKVVDKFYETVEKFIEWICQKFGIGDSKELIRNFEKDTNTLIDPEKQIKYEERNKECDIEIQNKICLLHFWCSYAKIYLVICLEVLNWKKN